MNAKQEALRAVFGPVDDADVAGVFVTNDFSIQPIETASREEVLAVIAATEHRAQVALHHKKRNRGLGCGPECPVCGGAGGCGCRECQLLRDTGVPGGEAG